MVGESAHCFGCGAGLRPEEFVRSGQCGACGRDTRVCRNCRHFDLGCADQCRETQAERVLDKERANFCDFFQPGSQTATPARPAQDWRKAAEALFKK